MLNDGEVEIQMGGETLILRPSPKAAREVSGSLGGFAEAVRRLGAFDLDAYAVVVGAGLRRSPNEVVPTIYDAGVINLVEPAVKFVAGLMNGGRHAPPDDEVGKLLSDAEAGNE